MTAGMVFDIQRFCIHDGPGIRTTVFLKGCPLRCKWCSNPESQAAAAEVFRNAAKCISCGGCEMVCPQKAISPKGLRREACIGCGACTDICPAGALTLKGQRMTVKEVLWEVKKDEVFYQNSDGGMTLSGGEPFFQPEFSVALLRAAKEAGLHTAVETTGMCELSVLQEAREYVDVFLYDVKCITREIHRQGTGTGNQKILENLSWLADFGAQIIARIPLIPGFNDNEEELAKIAQFLLTTKIRRADILKYHIFGETKYGFLDREYPMKAAYQEEQLDQLAQAAVDIFSGIAITIS